MTFTAAKPDATLLVHPADIAHAMDNGVTVLYFAEPVGGVIFIILAADQISRYGDFTDVTRGDPQVVRPFVNGFIADFNDTDIDVVYRASDAGTECFIAQLTGFIQYFFALDGYDRDRFGRAVRGCGFLHLQPARR